MSIWNGNLKYIVKSQRSEHNGGAASNLPVIMNLAGRAVDRQTVQPHVVFLEVHGEVVSVFDTLVKTDFTHSAGGEFVGGTIVVERTGDREGVGAVHKRSCWLIIPRLLFHIPEQDVHTIYHIGN